MRILKLEEDGFYWFVRHRAGKKEPWRYHVSEYKCSLCGGNLLGFLYYTLIEIHEEELSEDGGTQEVEGTRIDLAALCADCTFDLGLGPL